MSQKHRKAITQEQWKQAADEYELGLKHAVRIARELGVSPATVSREFKRRGCVKGSRVAEVIAPLEAELGAKARRRAMRLQAQQDAATERAAEIERLIGQMMRSIVAAAKAGDLSAAGSTIEKVGKKLGVSSLR